MTLLHKPEGSVPAGPSSCEVGPVLKPRVHVQLQATSKAKVSWRGTTLQPQLKVRIREGGLRGQASTKVPHSYIASYISSYITTAP